MKIVLLMEGWTEKELPPMARNLMPRLDPALVYQKCPNFKRMTDEMLYFARQALNT